MESGCKSQETVVGGDGVLSPFVVPSRASCARFSAACVAALGGACFFFGFAASATILKGQFVSAVQRRSYMPPK
jgi:hypothetical protein